MADQVEEVPGGGNANNYANVDLIVDIAGTTTTHHIYVCLFLHPSLLAFSLFDLLLYLERRGVQAVWAGWGHASENPRLPEALSKTKSKVAFIGPPAGPMRDLGIIYFWISYLFLIYYLLFILLDYIWEILQLYNYFNFLICIILYR